MSLETMRPDPAWDGPDRAVDILREHADGLTIRVWGGDWCKDCQAVLPGFAAALDASGIDPDSVAQYPVEKAADGRKIGPRVDAYDIDRIPTIVVERNGTELARFVESAPEGPAVVLANALAESEPNP